MDVTNVCIVGLGRAGRFHFESIKNLKNANLLSVVDPKLPTDDAIENDLKESKVYSNLEHALKDPALDAVIISSPTQYHFQQINLALTAGKHVFTEKPLGQGLNQIQESFRLARVHKKGLYLGFQRRYDNNFRVLKSKIPEISPVRIYRASSRDNPRPSLDYLKLSGNIFHDMLIHDFDLLLYLLGLQIPESIFAFGHAHDRDIAEIPDFDTVVVNIKYPDGMICTIDTSRTAIYGYDQRVELFGAGGLVTAHNQQDHTVEVKLEYGAVTAPANFSFPQRYKQAYQNEIADFISGITKGILYNVSEEECVLGHLIAETALASAVNNQLMKFEGVPEMD